MSVPLGIFMMGSVAMLTWGYQGCLLYRHGLLELLPSGDQCLNPLDQVSNLWGSVAIGGWEGYTLAIMHLIDYGGRTTSRMQGNGFAT